MVQLACIERYMPERWNCECLKKNPRFFHSELLLDESSTPIFPKKYLRANCQPFYRYSVDPEICRIFFGDAVTAQLKYTRKTLAGLPIKVSSDELVDFLFGESVEVLELVEGGEFDDVQSVGSDDVRFTFEKMLSLQAGDFRNCGEHVCQVRSGPFQTVSVVNLPFARLFIHVKLQKEGVKITNTNC